MKKVILAGVAATCLVVAPSAIADGAATVADIGSGCVTHGEFDALDWGLSTDQVANRFDTNGWLIAAGDEFFRRGYSTCWDTGRKVVVWFDLNLGLSDHWDIRDV